MVDTSGTIVANYRYNAWGKLYSQSGTMAIMNPLRYRGYYYDTETSFYYLQSRYYDPANCRFINADSYASTGQGFLGANMFIYCLTCPVMYCDDGGCLAIAIGVGYLLYLLAEAALATVVTIVAVILVSETVETVGTAVGTYRESKAKEKEKEKVAAAKATDEQKNTIHIGRPLLLGKI